MSATAFQRQRRKLLEQTSVAARMNEDGEGDPQAKTIKNYDQRRLKDMGTTHQQGDPPSYSLTPHTPEELHDPTAVEDEGTAHQQGSPPPSSVTLRADEKAKRGVEGDQYQDQRKYDSLDKREAPNTSASLENVNLYEGGITEERINATGGAKQLAEKEGVDLSEVKGSGSDGRISKSDVEKYLDFDKESEED